MHFLTEKAFCIHHIKVQDFKTTFFLQTSKEKVTYSFTVIENLWIIMQRRSTGNYKSFLDNFYEKDNYNQLLNCPFSSENKKRSHILHVKLIYLMSVKVPCRKMCFVRNKGY